MLDVSQLSVSFGRRPILADIGFQTAGGSVSAVLGRNGAGKSTLIRALAGLVPAKGKISLGGQDLRALPPVERGRRVGYVAQDLAIPSARLSVLDLLILVQNAHAIGWRVRDDAMARAEDILAALNLASLAHVLPAELSGGQRQMVALALALVRRPVLLLLDEPTSALDIANQLHLLTLVRDYTRRTGIVTIVILHDLNLVTRFADQALMLDQGSLVAAGPVGDMLNRERLADVYGIDCHVGTIENGQENGHAIIYPLAPIGTRTVS